MKTFKIIGLLIALSINSYAQSNHDNGGDEAERRWTPVRDNIRSWIQQGGHLALEFRIGENAPSYQENMISALNIPVEFVSVKDPRNLVQVNGLQKMCRNVVEEGKMRLRCIIESVLLIKDADFINIVHHEYAGIAGFETTDSAGESNYFYTNQLVSSIEAQVSYRLVVKPVVPAGYEENKIEGFYLKAVSPNFNVLKEDDLKTWIEFTSECEKKRASADKKIATLESERTDKSLVYAEPRFKSYKKFQYLQCDLTVVSKAGSYIRKSIDSVSTATKYSTNIPYERFFLVETYYESDVIFKPSLPITTNVECHESECAYFYEFAYLVGKESSPVDPDRYHSGIPSVAQDICRKFTVTNQFWLVESDESRPGLMHVPSGLYSSSCVIAQKGDNFEVSFEMGKRFKLKNLFKLKTLSNGQRAWDAFLRFWTLSPEMRPKVSILISPSNEILKIDANRPKKPGKRYPSRDGVEIKIDGKKYRDHYSRNVSP